MRIKGGRILRKLFLALLGILVVTGICFISYSRIFTISNDKKQLESNIIQFINRPAVVSNEIDIKQELTLDNKKYVLFIINNSLGDAELTQGLNNKYKIESTSYGDGSFRNEIIKTNKGKYLILKGKNPGNKISFIKVMLDNIEYKINIPEQEYFMVYCEVPIKTESLYIDIHNLKFYDVSNVDITEEMFKYLFSS